MTTTTIKTKNMEKSATDMESSASQPVVITPVAAVLAANEKKSERELADEKWTAVFFGVYGVLVFMTFIFSVEWVIRFTNSDVKNVCPNSQLWWVTLFMGIIFPLLFIVSAIHAAKSKKHSIILRHIFIWICLVVVSIIWALDQLVGVPGFANDTCAYDKFRTSDIDCENEDEGGHKLFVAVKNWIIIYIYLLVKCAFYAVHIYREKKKNETETSADTTVVPVATIV